MSRQKVRPCLQLLSSTAALAIKRYMAGREARVVLCLTLLWTSSTASILRTRSRFAVGTRQR